MIGTVIGVFIGLAIGAVAMLALSYVALCYGVGKGLNW